VQACWICGVEIDEDATACLACSVADDDIELDDFVALPLELDL
jgi:hypothetical protein